jgi:hypothetical protein
MQLLSQTGGTCVSGSWTRCSGRGQVHIRCYRAWANSPAPYRTLVDRRGHAPLLHLLQLQLSVDGL